MYTYMINISLELKSVLLLYELRCRVRDAALPLVRLFWWHVSMTSHIVKHLR